MLAISIPGAPVPWSRAGSSNGRRYTPSKQAAYMAAVATIARANMARAGLQPLDGAVELTYRATYPFPKSWGRRPVGEGIVFKTSKPDASNLVKIVEDALNGICFRDDAQVQLGSVQKVYGYPEGVVVTITPLSGAWA